MGRDYQVVTIHHYQYYGKAVEVEATFINALLQYLLLLLRSI